MKLIKAYNILNKRGCNFMSGWGGGNEAAVLFLILILLVLSTMGGWC